MPSERIQRQIDRLLDEAEAASARRDWRQVLDLADHVLTFDPENADALALAAVAKRGLGIETASGPAAPSAATPAPAPAPAPEPAHPTAFVGGRYQVKRFLGEGGKKRVYLAHDTLLDRDVAFALIKTDGLDPEGRARFLREAQAMGRLGAHPHIVTIYDIGEEPLDEHLLSPVERNAGLRPTQPYIVTELMAGGDVDARLNAAEARRLSLEEALRLAGEVANGLGFAHNHGLIHRDLKPGNVWLTAEGVAKIGDFGLSVSLDQSRLTRAGMMVGTVY